MSKEERRVKVIDELWDEAEEYTWQFYEDLEKRSKLSGDLLARVQCARKRRDENPDYCIMYDHDNMDLMPYFFRGLDYHPYGNFRVNRYKEDGEKIPFLYPDANGFLASVYTYSSAMKDQQYIKLEKELKNSAFDFERDSLEYFGTAMEIAKKCECDLLSDRDIEICLTSLFGLASTFKYFDELHNYYLHLLEKDVQDRYKLVLYESSSLDLFVADLRKTFRLSGGLIYKGIKFVYNMKEYGLFWSKELREQLIKAHHLFVGEGRQLLKKQKWEEENEKHAKVERMAEVEEIERARRVAPMKARIDEHFKTKKDDAEKDELVGYYLSLKLEMAEFARLISSDGKGGFIDNFYDIFYGRAEEQEE